MCVSRWTLLDVASGGSGGTSACADATLIVTAAAHSTASRLAALPPMADLIPGKPRMLTPGQLRMYIRACSGHHGAMRQSNPRALGLATAAFTVCFFAWSMLGPLGPTLQKQLDLTDFQLAIAVAIPVVLGSVMRIPIGILTERYGGRVVF